MITVSVRSFSSWIVDPDLFCHNRIFGSKSWFHLSFPSIFCLDFVLPRAARVIGLSYGWLLESGSSRAGAAPFLF